MVEKWAKLIEKVVDSVGLWLYRIAGGILAIMVAGNLYEVIARYIFNNPTGFMDELLTYGNMAIILLVLAYAWRTGGHVIVDIIPLRLAGRARARLGISTLVISCVILVLLAVGVWSHEVLVIEKGWRMYSTLETPRWISNLPFCVGITFFTLAVLVSLVKEARGFLPKRKRS